MANSKRLITWFSDFARENKIWALSIAVPLLGAIPLYIYSMSIGQLPDFSLGDLTGVLIASFLTEMIVGTVMVVYLLFAGFAARKAVNGFYPDPHIAVSDSSNAPSPVALDTHRYLIRGNFIVGVTIFGVLSWFGLATKSFDSWLAPQHPGIARWAYALSLSSVALLVLVDWRRGWRLLKYTLFASLAGSVAFLTVLAIAYLDGYAVQSPTVQMQPSSTSDSFRDVSVWVSDTSARLLGDWLVVTALTVAIAAASGAPILARITRARRSANRSGGTPRPFFKNDSCKLVAAKIAASFVFCFCSFMIFLFFGIVVDASPLHTQTVTAFVGGSYLIMLNCGAFAARDWGQRAWLCVATFAIVFVIVPLQSDNATLLPKIVVKSLGFGNVHATDIAFSGLECSTLASYGVYCNAKKDTSIGITNVNILNRLGSTVLVELQVRKTAEPSKLPKTAQFSQQASGVTTVVEPQVKYRTLALPADALAKKHIASWYRCNSMLLEQLRADDPAKADALACVTLSVPKEQVLGNSISGPATYSGDFSKYVSVSSAREAK